MRFSSLQDYHTHEICGAIRKELGFRTVFNILGPLDQPRNALPAAPLSLRLTHLVEPLAQVLINLGIKRGMVGVWAGQAGRDLLSAPTTALRDPGRLVQVLGHTPEDFGFDRCKKRELAGGRRRRTPPSPGLF